jgi:pSer/pThr/pTyr-binding forkhead associated (FHA) protein
MGTIGLPRLKRWKLTITATARHAKGSRRKGSTMAFLEIYTGREPGRQFHLGDTASIGRNTDNDIMLPDARASRYHARITRREECFLLEDLASSNGTFVGDERLSPATQSELVDGNEIRIGSTRLIFHLYRFVSSSSEIPRPAAWLPNPPRKA